MSGVSEGDTRLGWVRGVDAAAELLLARKTRGTGMDGVERISEQFTGAILVGV